MNRHRIYQQRKLLTALGCLLSCWSCGPAPAAVVTPPRHLVKISRPGLALYIDRVDNRAVIEQQDSSAGKTFFCSFLVGWQDSASLPDNKQSMDREKYFQYGMQKDWVAVIKGDSLYPVFFQEKPALDKRFKEGIMVFEVPRGAKPDTLLYKDSFGPWGKQLFVLNRK